MVRIGIIGAGGMGSAHAQYLFDGNLHFYEKGDIIMNNTMAKSRLSVSEQVLATLAAGVFGILLPLLVYRVEQGRDR